MTQGPAKVKKSPLAGNGRRLAADTERAFIAAATELFAERGYNGTSIADLSKKLGLTTASLYYYVSGKQELLLRVLETGIGQFLQRLEDIVAEDADPRDKLRLALENHLHFVLHNKDGVAVYLRERRFLESPYREQYQERVDRYDRLFTEIIDSGMSAGTMPPGDPHLLRLAILGMINWVVEWYQPGGRLAADEIMRTYTDLILDRILAPPSGA